jgi:AcrR family transcriptional regulator
MSRPHTLDDPAARRAVLSAADREFYAHGVAGVGMTEIRDTSAVSLKRLYGLYPSKRELVAAWLEDRHVTWMAWFTGAIERLTVAGADPLLAPFDAIALWAATPGYRGCAFLNTAAEVTEIDDTHRAVIAAHKQAVTDHLAGIARATGAANPDALGVALAVLLDGAIVQAAVFGSVAPVAAARSAASTLIASAR